MNDKEIHPIITVLSILTLLDERREFKTCRLAGLFDAAIAQGVFVDTLPAFKKYNASKQDFIIQRQIGLDIKDIILNV